MKLMIVCILIVFLCGSAYACENVVEYEMQRALLVEKANSFGLARHVELDRNELLLQAQLKEAQRKETSSHLLNGFYPPAHNFYIAKEVIDKSPLLETFRAMPKGGILHLHLWSAASWDWLVSNATYRADAYLYVSSDESAAVVGRSRSPYSALADDGGGKTPLNWTIGFFGDDDVTPRNDANWRPMSAVRNAYAGGVEAFDRALYVSLTMVGKQEGSYVQLWKHFTNIFARLHLTYAPVFREFIYDIFAKNVAEGLQHLELRIAPTVQLVDASGAKLGRASMFDAIADVIEQARDTLDSDFTCRCICASSRHMPREAVADDQSLCIDLMEAMPNLIVGFDLDGPEDEGHSLNYFVPEFLAAQREAANRTATHSLPYFFHAGETNLPPSLNSNLFDAYLLGAHRVGHGFALAEQFPLLVELYKQANLALEVSPISNQLLRFVPDLQTHPAFKLLRDNVTISISSDDPGIYGYSGNSYDFWEVFFAWQLDLAQLKQLAYNSLATAAWQSDEQRNQAIDTWLQRWHRWVQLSLNVRV
jgi:adenosine deaminase CECR1